MKNTCIQSKNNTSTAWFSNHTRYDSFYRKLHSNIRILLKEQLFSVHLIKLKNVSSFSSASKVWIFKYHTKSTKCCSATQLSQKLLESPSHAQGLLLIDICTQKIIKLVIHCFKILPLLLQYFLRCLNTTTGINSHKNKNISKNMLHWWIATKLYQQPVFAYICILNNINLS